MTALARRSLGLAEDVEAFSGPPGGWRRRRVHVEHREPAPAAVFGSADMPQWLEPTVARLSGLLRLPKNWDGHGANPPRRDVIMFALQLLGQVLDTDTPAPQIVPLSNGGIQIEWHLARVDFEIEIREPNRVTASFEPIWGPAPAPLALRSDFGGLTHWVAALKM